MGYIANNTRVSSLTIGGGDYTNKLVSWTVSDSSANKNGCIQTTGSLVIGQKIGAQSLDDYERDSLRRGDEVILKITAPGSGEQIHPRGHLYVISSVYVVEEERLSIEIGCRLALLSLMEKGDEDQLDELRALVPMELDTAQSTYSNCCAGLASMGQYVFQNNQGALEVNSFWEGDGFGVTAPGEWLSVLGVTTNSVNPLAGSGAIPDEIKLSYQVPSDSIAVDNKGKVDLVETESYYFYQYPVVSFTRQNTDATPDNPNGTLNNVGSVTSSAGASAPTSSSCGNTPEPPQGEVQEPSCNEGYILTQTPVYLPAYRTAKQTTTYDGPGAQVSTVLTEEFGPKVEANGQYFADQYAFCRQTWGTACQPNGDCPYYGTDQIQLGYTLQTNFYGDANELVKTITDTYLTLLSAAQPSDWRAGNVAGTIQNFDDSLGDNTGFYRSSRTKQTYTQEDNANIQTTTNWVSVTSRRVGITGGQDLDAVRGGIKTKTVRTSTTITTLDVQPDILNSSTTATTQKTVDIILFLDRYTKPPTESGPYIIEEQIPQPLLFEDESDIEEAVAAYSDYLTRFVKGDAMGLQIGEGLNPEVVSGWRPGMPFRYHDKDNDVLLAMRMDACAWGVTLEQCSFVTNGLWNGVSNGIAVPPNNLVGNSQPDMSVPPSGIGGGGGGGNGGGGGGGSPTPPSPPTGGDVIDEDFVDAGPIIFTVDVHFTFQSIANTFNVDGIGPLSPEPAYATGNWTTTCYVQGLVVGSGDLLSTELNGSIPAEYQGNLVTAGATVINADLFAEVP